MIDAERIVQVLGGPKLFRRKVVSLGELAKAVRAGLPKKALRMVASQVSEDTQAATKLMYRIIPEASFKRRKTALNMSESERTERLARVIATAQYVWADDEQARQFLTTPHALLDQQTPLDTSFSELGARQVEELLWQLFYGLPV